MQIDIKHFINKTTISINEFQYILELYAMKTYYQDHYIIVLALLVWDLKNSELTRNHRKHLIEMFKNGEIVTSNNHILGEDNRRIHTEICAAAVSHFKDEHVITSLDDFELFLKNKCKV